MALQRQKREQEAKEQRELERNSPAKKKGSLGSSGGGSAASLLCAVAWNASFMIVARTLQGAVSEQLKVTPKREVNV